MDAESLKALFEPFGPVAVKRMFGGHGVYAAGLCFAIEATARFPEGGRSLPPDLRGGRVDAVHLQRPRQGHADVVLALAGDRPRRNRGASPLGRNRSGGGATRGGGQGEAENTGAGEKGLESAQVAATSVSSAGIEPGRCYSSASAGSRAAFGRALTERLRKSGTWSPSPITGASFSRCGRSRRGV
jgi:hypothetical protein